MADKVESLYFGDMRLDNLEKDITEYIHNRVGGTDITYASVVGLLEKIKLKLLKQMSEEDEAWGN